MAYYKSSSSQDARREKRHRRQAKFAKSSFASGSEKRGLIFMAILVCFVVSLAINFWFEAAAQQPIQ